MYRIKVYTDGSCLNQGATIKCPGGWAYQVIWEDTDGNLDVPKPHFGGSEHTSNNRMELTAVLEALVYITAAFYGYSKEEYDIEICSDSSHIVDGMNQGWVANWQKRNWNTKEGVIAKNLDLWLPVYYLSKKFNVKYVKVQGHSGDKWNELVNDLAYEQMRHYAKIVEPQFITGNNSNKE